MGSIRKYINRINREQVSAIKYDNINDFEKLYTLVGDIYPALSSAHTRVWEGNWIVRKSDNQVEMICCSHPDDDTCFNNKYELLV